MLASDFKHGTWNLQRRPVRDLDKVLDFFDETLEWDAWSFQEIATVASDFAAPDTYIVIDNIGKRRRSIILAPPSPGSLAVAVAVNCKWAKSVFQVRFGYRCVSVLLKASTTTSAVTSIQIVSAHLPPTLNHPIEDFERSVREVGALLGGIRRNHLCLGIDANVELSKQWASPRLVGRAVQGPPQPRRESVSCEAARILQDEMRCHRLMATNTFHKAWKDMDSVPQYTWKGPIFGHWKEAVLDYVMIDDVTAEGDFWISHLQPVSFASDHAGLLLWFRLREPLTLRGGPQRKRFVNLQPLDAEEYNAMVTRKAAGTGPMTISDLLTLLLEAAQAGPVRPRRPPPKVMAVSAIEEALRAVLRSASSSPERRAEAHAALWQRRHAIAIEKSTSLAAHTLRNMRGGGWGERHLRPQQSGMPFLQTPSGPVVDPEEIRSHANLYYSSLFSRPPVQYAQEDDAL